MRTAQAGTLEARARARVQFRALEIAFWRDQDTPEHSRVKLGQTLPVTGDQVHVGKSSLHRSLGKLHFRSGE